MTGVFINFRSQDEPGFAALLQREFSRWFGAGAVFYASLTVPAGEDYELGLLHGVRQARVLVAVIGPRWLTSLDGAGVRAIDRPGDWVRREIAEAFSCGTRVIPVLVNDTGRLTGVPLPVDINRLSRCQYLRLRHEDLEHDLARIAQTVGRYLQAPAPDRTPVRGGQARGLSSVRRVGGSW
jgi:hypothetical protein